jgi:hypothetical protein
MKEGACVVRRAPSAGNDVITAFAGNAQLDIVQRVDAFLLSIGPALTKFEDRGEEVRGSGVMPC